MENDDESVDLLAIVAHELRKPLSSLVFALDLLDDHAASDPELASFRERVGRNVSSMVEVVDRLVELAQLTSGQAQLRVAPVALSRIVQRGCDAVRPVLERQQHELAVDLPEPDLELDVDGDRIAHALTHLLLNAALYTPRGGHIHVKASADAENLTLCVIDDGQGIAPERLEELVSPFDRPRSRRPEGLGTGLPYARAVAKLHAGRLELRSEGAERGTEAHLSIPRVAPEGAVPTRMPERVLVVRGHSQEQRVVELLVRSWAHEMHVADDIAHLPAAIETFSPDAVIVDWTVPRSEVQTLQNLEAPIVLIAGEEADAELARCATTVVPPPVDPHVLEVALRHVALEAGRR